MDIGLDVHKKMSYYSMVDRQGTEVKKGRFPTTREGLNEFASTLPEGAKVAIEALTSGIFVYEYRDGKRIEVHLAHPVYVKPFAKKHVKTDKVDARVLAQLLSNRLKARRGEKVAIVATARHMAESVYWVLTRKESYKE